MHTHASRIARHTAPAPRESGSPARRPGSLVHAPGARCACGGGCPRCETARDRARGAALAAAVLPALHSSSHPLAADERGRMERDFGRNFGAVRLHTGATAARSTARLGARAYTVGSDIVFGAGEYRPGSQHTRRLLAHELAHVAQEGNHRPAPPVMRLGARDDSAERWAQHASDAIGSGASPGPVPAPLMSAGDAVIVRRSHTFTSPPTAYENLAELVIGPGYKVAVALALLNGTRVIGAPPNELAEMQAAARSAIRFPDIKPEIIGDTGTAEAPAYVYRATVREVRANDGGAEVSLLTPPPWKFITTRSVVRKALYIQACAGPDACELQAHGKPSDQVYEAAIRTHEERHAADNRTAFDTTIAAWDDKLTEAQRTKLEFTGSLAEVTTKLWAHMGGKPEEVAAAYAKAVFDLGQAYHAAEPHPRSAPMNAIATTPDCSTAAVDVVPVK